MAKAFQVGSVSRSNSDIPKIDHPQTRRIMKIGAHRSDRRRAKIEIALDPDNASAIYRPAYTGGWERPTESA